MKYRTDDMQLIEYTSLLSREKIYYTVDHDAHCAYILTGARREEALRLQEPGKESGYGDL